MVSTFLRAWFRSLQAGVFWIVCITGVIFLLVWSWHRWDLPEREVVIHMSSVTFVGSAICFIIFYPIIDGQRAVLNSDSGQPIRDFARAIAEAQQKTP